MNYNMLTVKEILRVAEPSTGLEEALFGKIEDEVNDSEYWRGRVGELENHLEFYDCDDCGAKEDELADMKDENDKLKALLDDNDIDYSEL